MATNVYIDGFNFYFGAVKGTRWKWVDFQALAQLLVPEDELGRISYFTAKVAERYPGDSAPSHQSIFLRAVRSNPNIETTLGHFRSSSKWRPFDERHAPFARLVSPSLRPTIAARVPWAGSRRRRTEPFTAARIIHREEKGSDVNLAVQLLWDCLREDCRKAIVISNDADLEDAIRKAVIAGCTVGIVNPQRQPTNKRLKDAATFEIPFRREVLEKCQMPDIVVTGKGKQVHRPRAWRT